MAGNYTEGNFFKLFPDNTREYILEKAGLNTYHVQVSVRDDIVSVMRVSDCKELLKHFMKQSGIPASVTMEYDDEYQIRLLARQDKDTLYQMVQKLLLTLKTFILNQDKNVMFLDMSLKMDEMILGEMRFTRIAPRVLFSHA